MPSQTVKLDTQQLANIQDDHSAHLVMELWTYDLRVMTRAPLTHHTTANANQQQISTPSMMYILDKRPKTHFLYITTNKCEEAPALCISPLVYALQWTPLETNNSYYKQTEAGKPIEVETWMGFALSRPFNSIFGNLLLVMSIANLCNGRPLRTFNHIKLC